MADRTEKRRAALHSTSFGRNFVSFATFCLLSSLSVGIQAQGCSYKYVEHLILDPTCSPYVNGIMKLECTVEVPLNATDITIGWFLNCEQLSNDSHVTITPQVIQSTEVRRLRSQLRINDMTDDYAGEYTCNILGAEEYVPSDQLVLRDSDYLEVEAGLGPCPNGNIYADNTVPAEEKCAVISEENAVPMSLICESPPATSSQTLPSTSAPVLLTTSTSLPLPSSSSSPPPPLSPTNVPTSSNPTTSMPSPTDPTVDTSRTQDPTSIWLYVVVAIAAVFFMIIIVLAIVCVGMCVHRNRSFDEALSREVVGKHIASLQQNTGYEGSDFYPGGGGGHTSSPLPPLPNHPSNPSPYNTMETAEYEIVGPGSDYQRLERPTLKATSGMMSRLGSSPGTFSPSTTMTSVYPVSTTPTSRNGGLIGGVPPPLPSMPRLGGASKLPYSPESSTTFDSAFHTGVIDASSPLERDRLDSSSLLLPKEKMGGSTMGAAEFEGCYSYRDQRHSPTSPALVSHPLHNNPDTGASFPEPRNPHPFPTTTTYESIPGDDTSSSGVTMVVAGYEKPLSCPSKSGATPRSVTLPVRSPHVSPPPSDGRAREATVSVHHNCFREAGNGRAVTLSPQQRLQQEELELDTMSGPTYHTLEQTSDTNGQHSLSNGVSYPVIETADFTLDSESSGTNTLTPGFPVVSADFADLPANASFPVSKVRPQRRQLGNELSSDFTGDSDYPQLDDALTDCTGGSTTTAYPESEWTGGTSTTGGTNGTLAGDSTVFKFNGRLSSHSGSTGSAGRSGGTVTPLSDSHRPSSTESSHTPNRSLSSGDPTPNILPLNGMTSPNELMYNGGIVDVAVPNGSCSVTAQFPRVPPGSSHTVPANSGGCAVSTQGGGGGGGLTSHTISSARNHYKKLDPTTMDPRLKYTRLNVGKLTVV